MNAESALYARLIIIYFMGFAFPAERQDPESTINFIARCAQINAA